MGTKNAFLLRFSLFSCCLCRELLQTGRAVPLAVSASSLLPASTPHGWVISSVSFPLGCDLLEAVARALLTFVGMWSTLRKYWERIEGKRTGEEMEGREEGRKEQWTEKVNKSNKNQSWGSSWSGPEGHGFNHPVTLPPFVLKDELFETRSLGFAWTQEKKHLPKVLRALPSVLFSSLAGVNPSAALVSSPRCKSGPPQGRDADPSGAL